VVAYETNVCDTIDPLAGSYYIEKLTDEVEPGPEYIDQIDRMGGAVAAIEKGFIQKEIGASAYRSNGRSKGRAHHRGPEPLPDPRDKLTGLLKVDPEVGAKQVAAPGTEEHSGQRRRPTNPGGTQDRGRRHR